MGLNSTQEEQVAKAELELVLKNRLEVNFRKDLNRMFRVIAADLAKTIVTTGGTVSATAYTPRTQLILDKHFKRTQRAFSKEIINFLAANKNKLTETVIRDLTAIAKANGKNINHIIDKLKRDTQIDLTTFRNASVAESANIITRTTQKEIDKAVSKSVSQLTEELGREPTNKEVAKASRANFLRRSSGRSNMIAATEVQKAAESTKQIERDNFLGARNNSTATQLELEPIEPKEVWVTQADSLVRAGDGTVFNHLAADGQAKIGGVFTVSGQVLGFPGDTSLGASAGNVINCRCSSVTVIE